MVLVQYDPEYVQLLGDEKMWGETSLYRAELLRSVLRMVLGLV